MIPTEAIRRRIRVISVTVSLFTLLITGFSVWLWYWQPPSDAPQSAPLIRMTLSQAIHDTTLVLTFPKLQGMSVRFVKPDESAKLSANSIIAINYNALNKYWYAGQVEIFYADVLGFPEATNRRSAWVVENHELFPHSVPLSSQISAWRRYIQKVKMLLGTAPPLKASSSEIFDASTGTSLGAVRTESGGF